MEISRLVKVVNSLGNKIEEYQIRQLVNNLEQALQTYISNRQNSQNVRASFMRTLNAVGSQLLSAIQNILPESINDIESDVYESVNAFEVFGSNGMQRIQNIISNTDQTSIDNIRLYREDISRIVEFSSLLPKFNFKQDVVSQKKEHDLIILIFQKGVSIESVEQLSKESNRWNQILISFARLVKDNDRSFVIENVEKGSLILTISAAGAAVLGFGKAVNYILDIIKKYYEIKKVALELKKLNLEVLNAELASLQEKSNIKPEEEAASITTKLLKEFNWQDNDADKHEVENHLNSSIETMIHFLMKGGKAEISLLPSRSEEEKNEEKAILVKYNEVALAENKVTLIEKSNSNIDLLEDKN